jgi:hypothetical protein
LPLIIQRAQQSWLNDKSKRKPQSTTVLSITAFT